MILVPQPNQTASTALTWNWIVKNCTAFYILLFGVSHFSSHDLLVHFSALSVPHQWEWSAARAPHRVNQLGADGAELRGRLVTCSDGFSICYNFKICQGCTLIVYKKKTGCCLWLCFFLPICSSEISREGPPPPPKIIPQLYGHFNFLNFELLCWSRRNLLL